MIGDVFDILDLGQPAICPNGPDDEVGFALDEEVNPLQTYLNRQWLISLVSNHSYFYAGKIVHRASTSAYLPSHDLIQSDGFFFPPPFGTAITYLPILAFGLAVVYFSDL